MKKLIPLFTILLLSLSAKSQWLPANATTGSIYYNNGNVGLGIILPASKLDIQSDNSLLRLHGSSFVSSTPLEVINLGAQGATGAMNAVFRIGYPYATGVNSGNKLDLLKVLNGNTILASSEAGASLGNVGIGTTTPTSLLQLYRLNNSTMAIGNTNSGYTSMNFGTSADAGGYSYITSIKSEGTAWGDLILNRSGGNVGIGTTVTDAKLTVKGSIHSQEVNVDLNVPGPDYVFESTYSMPSLEELNAYIKVNKHLPEVPSACAMEENGVKLGEMNMLLLKKVEELTLYVIELQKENKRQDETIERLQVAK